MTRPARPRSPSSSASRSRRSRTGSPSSTSQPDARLRGCRLAIKFPEIGDMQVRAIIEAAIEVKNKGKSVLPEIMIPLVGTVEELSFLKKRAIRIADECMAKAGTKVEYLIGTMIEVPRAALTADKIAEEAQFFSFGTNDLTQMTFGFSRDDIGSFVPAYVDHKILPVDPFQTLDASGVGQLVEMGTTKGRGVAARRSTASTSRSGSAASTAATPSPSPSATRWAWTTSPAPRSASRSPASPPRRRRSPMAKRSAATADRRRVVADQTNPAARPSDHHPAASRRSQTPTRCGRRLMDDQFLPPTGHQTRSPGRPRPGVRPRCGAFRHHHRLAGRCECLPGGERRADPHAEPGRPARRNLLGLRGPGRVHRSRSAEPSVSTAPPPAGPTAVVGVLLFFPWVLAGVPDGQSLVVRVAEHIGMVLGFGLNLVGVAMAVWWFSPLDADGRNAPPGRKRVIEPG